MLSICVALKNRSRVLIEGHELRLFPNCVESIRLSIPSGASAELVVADWNSDDWPLCDWLPRAAGHLGLRIVPMTGPFSRGRGLNAAASASSGDILFFTDADCLMCPGLFEAGIRDVNANTAFFPVLYSYSGPEHRDGWWRHSGYGNCMVSRRTWQDAGGWPEYNTWGKEDDDFLKRVSALVNVIRQPVTGFFHQWHPDDILWKDRYGDRDPAAIQEIESVRLAVRELAETVPTSHSIVLVDEARFGMDGLDGRQVLPFLEAGGEYAGPPPNDETAIRELERMRSQGASFIAFAWMAFWWLDHYTELRRHLYDTFPCVLENSRLVVFDLSRVNACFSAARRPTVAQEV